MDSKQNGSQGYGVISMMALTIGIVIGSGIFAMNSELIKTNGSIFLTSISWLIGSLLVISILVAFLEIISITDILDEQATLSNWGKQLLGVKFGKTIGYFITFVYIPMLIAGLMSVSGMFGLQSIDLIVKSSGGETILGNPWIEFGWVTGIVIIVLILISLSNANYIKPGKYFQNIGTIIKIIPLLFVVGLFFLMLIMGDLNFKENIEYINNNPDKFPNSSSGWESVSLVLLTLPAILFSFDGFLLAGPLSKEAKTKTTFKISFIISILIIIIIYILFSIATLGLGDASKENYGGVVNAINATFKDKVASDVIAIILQIFLTISLITGVSGLTIGGARMVSDLSSHNSLMDKTGILITKNKHGVTPVAGKYISLSSFFWFGIYQILNIINISQGGSSLEITFFALNLPVIFAFVFYVLVIIGAIINRYTCKVEVKKNSFFIPFAIIASLSTLGISLYFIIDTLLPIEYWINNSIQFNWTLYWIKLSLFFIFLTFIISFTIYNVKKTNEITNEIIEFKKIKSEIYYKTK